MPVITFICTECDEGCVVAQARDGADKDRLPQLECKKIHKRPGEVPYENHEVFFLMDAKWRRY